MINEILIVDDVRSVIRNWGPEFAHNQIVQELAGHYWFIDIDWECEKLNAAQGLSFKPCEGCEFEYGEAMACGTCDKVKPALVDCGDCTKCLYRLPLKIAWFILEAVRIQKHMLGLSIPPTNDSILLPKLKSYIPASVSESGEIEPIPAEIGVLHVKEV